MRPPRTLLALGIGLAAACGEAPAPPEPAAASAPDPLLPLRAFEAARRAAADFARLPPSDKAMGPDPYAIRRVPGTPYLVSTLRGRDAVVLLDADLRELDRAPAPASPTGLAVTAGGDVLASGEGSGEIHRYAVRGAALAPAGRLALAGVHGVRDLAAGPEGVVYALDERAGALLTLELTPGFELARRSDEAICDGPFRVERLRGHLVIDCLLDHTLVVRRVGEGGRAVGEGEARIRHDGPIWGFAAAEVDGGVLIAAGGVEDRPLDRTGGSFGYIDSFVSLYRIGAEGGAPAATRGAALLAAVNVSELGVITPKAIHLDASGEGVRVIATGYGGAARAELRWPSAAGLSGTPEVAASPFPPGAAALVALEGGGLAFADPLLDAWLLDRGGAVTTVAARDGGAPARSADSRIGEALFFTSLMAPWNRTEGELSRFTCETCHFEGYVDGRTHHTGRGDVRATTKPLLGLFNNRPHFSRALDPDLATMVDNEFRAAGARSGHDPWFSLGAADAPWIEALGIGAEPLPPEALRRALMAFLMELTHRPNPAAVGRSRFAAAERSGAEVFQARCAGCHAPRLSADEPGSAAPFARWEALVLSREGPIVWGIRDYEKTGVTPYVHEDGARVPSLRRLYKKRPYFTNGSARTLREVLERARFGEGGFSHAGAPAAGTGEALRPAEVDALLAFLDLL